MFEKGNDLRKTIVLEKDPHFVQQPGDMGTVQILEYSPNKIRIKVNAKGKSLMFLSDTYYSEWEATVNSVQTPILRADFAFRAVVVNKGENMVEFSYNPISFWYGIFFAGVGMLFAIAFQRLFAGYKVKP